MGSGSLEEVKAPAVEDWLYTMSESRKGRLWHQGAKENQRPHARFLRTRQSIRMDSSTIPSACAKAESV